MLSTKISKFISLFFFFFNLFFTVVLIVQERYGWSIFLGFLTIFQFILYKILEKKEEIELKIIEKYTKIINNIICNKVKENKDE